jgi:membrane-associated phospholipid phosphatase
MNKRRPYLVALLLTAIFCIAAWFLLDIRLALFFRQFRAEPWLGFWDTVTDAGQSEWYLIGGLALFLALRRRNRRAAISGIFLSGAVALSGLAADLLKALFGRARPMLLFDQGIYGLGGPHYNHEWTSFPSGHSATALSVAWTLSLLFPRFRPLFLAGGLLVAASRMVLTHHYLSDVVAGSMLGVATVMLLYQRYFRKALDEARTV